MKSFKSLKNQYILLAVSLNNSCVKNKLIILTCGIHIIKKKEFDIFQCLVHSQIAKAIFDLEFDMRTIVRYMLFKCLVCGLLLLG